MRTSALATVVLAALTLAAGCASSPGAPQAASPAGLDPVGTYEFTAVAGSQSTRGTARVHRGEDGALGGTVSIPAIGEMPVSAVEVEESRVTLTAAGSSGPMVLIFDGDGEQFRGEWRYMGMSGTLTGRRR